MQLTAPHLCVKSLSAIVQEYPAHKVAHRLGITVLVWPPSRHVALEACKVDRLMLKLFQRNLGILIGMSACGVLKADAG